MSDAEQSSIKLYGATWCGDTRRARAWLDANHVPYEWVDVDGNKDAEALVIKCSNGNRTIPVIIFADGSILVEPSTLALEEHAKALQLVPNV
jgi:mycoredoxin